ncbi:MAG: ATP-binding protein, partial [Thermodesulfobacteriota bacterium]|nr:ATP-binding protein [Thermodesulfobacteriota bacterium]
KVIKAIEKTSKEAGNIQNDSTYQISISKKTFHEFQIVFETMNTMAAQINRQIDELSESRDLLEINVRERTEELFNTNEDLKNKVIEKINAEKELVESNSRLYLAAEASNALVWEWNPEQSLFYLDKRSWDIIGTSGRNGAMTLEKFAELHYPEEFEVIKEKITSLLKRKSSLYINEHRVFVQNREWRWFRSYGTLVQKNKKGGFLESVVGIAVDITDLKHAEESNRILEERLQQSQKMEAMGTLAGGVAHDFNNILGAITGYSQLGKMSVSKDSKTAAHLDQVLQACKRATEIVKQILTFSRQTKSEKSLCDMGSIINEALKLLRASIPSTIEIQKNIQRKIGTVMVDPTQIHQVIINLCTNAYHAMKKSGGTLNLSLEAVRIDNPELYDTPGLTPGEYLCLTVTDTGNGMDKDIIKKIFDPYFTTKEKEEGTGMGLAIVHGIVMDHGGAITVKSIMEKGTSFYLYFPVVDQKLTKEPIETFGELLSGTGEFVYGTGKILVVDDEKIIADVTEEMLKDLGYEVLSETDSAKALEIIKKDPDNFDLVISDLIMPKITGEVLAEEIHKIRKEMPVIISTGLGKNVPLEIIEKSGAAAFLKKPFDIDDLAKIVQKVLSK